MPRVLVVEDEPDIAEALRDLLESEGYDVACAGHGREALDEIERAKPDVIVTDVMMPVMNGNEMLAELSRRGHSDIPVIVTSAATSDAAWPIAATFLGKPFTFDELLLLIRQLVE
jgi:CheY-like chemotaxis protein